MTRNVNPSTALMWLVCLFMLAACTKNENEEPEQTDTDYPKHLLVSIHQTGTTSYDSLFYVANKLVSVASYTSPMSSYPSYDVAYTVGNNGKVSSARTFYDRTLDRKDTLRYEQGKVFVFGELAAGAGQLWKKDTVVLTVNANGQIQQATFSEPGYQAQCTYEYTGKNLIRYTREETTSYTTGNSVQSKLVVTVDYDDKPNPAYGVSRYNLLFDPVWNSTVFWPHGSMANMTDAFNTFDSYNNPKSVRLVETSEGTTQAEGMIDYTYEYDNETGFPISQTMTVHATTSGGVSSPFTDSGRFLFLYSQPQ